MIKGLKRSGFIFDRLMDLILWPHNGCRLSKEKRRVSKDVLFPPKDKTLWLRTACGIINRFYFPDGGIYLVGAGDKNGGGIQEDIQNVHQQNIQILQILKKRGGSKTDKHETRVRTSSARIGTRCDSSRNLFSPQQNTATGSSIGYRWGVPTGTRTRAGKPI